MTNNLLNCMRGFRHTLVLSGAFHAMKSPVKNFTTTYQNIMNLRPELRITNGYNASPPDDISWYERLHKDSSFPSFGFEVQIIVQPLTKFYAVDTKDLPVNLRTAIGPAVNKFDFYIFGPPSPTNGQ